MDLVYKILIVVVAVAIFIISYLLNQKTKVPNGCEKLTNCTSCGNQKCINKKNNDKENDDNEK